MLQQTRLEVVAPAYRRFLRAFPTLHRLASAGEDEVLSLWSGLGYYSRARSLHRAARGLIEDGARTFPCNWDSALALPGVGDYTAAAVLSIAYGLPYPAIDGNIARVVSRLACIERPQEARALAADLLDRKRPGDWNQALMELGQTICLPRAPRCSECPIRNWCAARERDVVERLPVRTQRRSSERLRLRLTLMRDREGRLLLQRGAFPFLRHLWLPPIRVQKPRSLPSKPPRPPWFRHAILHRLLEVEVDQAVLPARALERRAKRPPPGIEAALFAPQELASIGRSALLTKALRLASS